jgi:hypothetical protein
MPGRKSLVGEKLNVEEMFMKPVEKILVSIFLVLFVVAGIRADTSLTINSATPYGCLQNAFAFPPPVPSVTSSFLLTNSSGSATMNSRVPASAPTFGYPPDVYFYNYTLDLSKLSSPSAHCVKLLVHFGPPQGCDVNEVWGDPTQIQSATLAPFGDITFVFNGGCLTPGQSAVTFTMFSAAPYKTGTVTIIDDFLNTQTGLTNEERINVAALVPDIPPDPPPWVFYYPAHLVIPYGLIQGVIDNGSNTPPVLTNLVNGPYNFKLQLVNSISNGLAVSPVVTQTVQVVNGLFTAPLPFDPDSFINPAWLNISVAPPNGTSFTPIGPPLPMTPTPQAYYAYTAGAVADLTPGQAVTSLNGLTDAVNLQAGNGISLGISGNAITISATGSASDRNIKTDFAQVNAEAILAKLASLPVESWRYTNEMAGIRHVGPMAQDFKTAFGLGNDGKIIGFVDAQGVALAAIQGLNQKLNEKDAEIQKLQQQNLVLEKRLDKLEQTVNANSKDEK